ncbi:MAG: hypothetical protein ACI8PT_000869 [Gammaproteobacteria bacterium]|jgi:hypothetical protein
MVRMFASGGNLVLVQISPQVEPLQALDQASDQLGQPGGYMPQVVWQVRVLANARRSGVVLDSCAPRPIVHG